MSDPIAHLLALRERATSGPWVANGCDIRAHYTYHDHRMAYASTAESAAFIVALVNSFPALVARLAAAESCATFLERLATANLIEGSTSYTKACEMVEAWHSLRPSPEKETKA